MDGRAKQGVSVGSALPKQSGPTLVDTNYSFGLQISLRGSPA